MIHLYHGDGKGKTTAAVGLTVRAAGSGMRALFVQFFKDGSSSEIGALASLPGVETRNPAVHYGFFRSMSDAQKDGTRESYNALLKDVAEHAADYGLIVLDEVVSAYRYGMLDREALERREAGEEDGPEAESAVNGKGAENGEDAYGEEDAYNEADGYGEADEYEDYENYEEYEEYGLDGGEEGEES